MAIFVLLRFPYPGNGAVSPPCGGKAGAGGPTCGTTCVESSGGARNYSPCCGERTSMPAGLRASSGSETPVIGAMPAALRAGAGV